MNFNIFVNYHISPEIVDLIITVKVLNSVLHVESAKCIAIIYLSIQTSSLCSIGIAIAGLQ